MSSVVFSVAVCDDEPDFRSRLIERMAADPRFAMSHGLRHHVERRALAAGTTAFFPKDGTGTQVLETLHLHLARHVAAAA